MQIISAGYRKLLQVRGLAVLAALLLTAPIACNDRSGTPLAPQGTGGKARFAVSANYSSMVSDPGLPINRIRLTARDRTTNAVVGSQIVDVNSSDAQWTLTLDVTLASNAADLIVTMELIHTEGGVDAVQWAGTTSVHAVVGQVQDVARVELYRGPPENLTVTGVSIARPVPSLIEGAGTTLSATVQGSPNAQLFWSSLDPTIASVSNTGVVSTTLPGNARIVASAGPRSDTAVIVVRQRVASLAITPATTTLESIGAETVLQAHVLDPRAVEIVGTNVTWTSGDATILESLGNGRFRARRNGTVSVTAAVESIPTVRNTASITIAQRVSSVAIDPSTITLTSIGARQTFTATGRDANGNAVAGARFTWSSSVPAVATVDASGVATARGTGATRIHASAPTIPGSDIQVLAVDSVGGDATLNVVQTVSAVLITPASLTMTALLDTARLSARAVDGSGTTITGKTFAWTSTNAGVVSVDGTGKITAVSPGGATIRASTDGVLGGADIEVSQTVTRVDVTPATASATTLNQNIQFTATARDRRNNTVAGRAVTWTSSNAAVATVNGAGLATSHAVGGANIVATVDGVPGSGALTVTAPVASVTVTPVTPTVASGATLQLTATVRDAGNNALTGRLVTWSSADTGKATVSATGLVTGRHVGPVVITATSEGVSGTTTVTVGIGTASLISKFDGDNQTAPVSTTLPVQVVAKVTDALGNPVNGVNVAWTVISGGGSVDSVNSTTDTNGLARRTWTLGATVGPQTLQARATTLPGTPSVLFSATGTGSVSVSRTWVGGAPAGARDWFIATNWSPAGVPADIDVVTVPVGPANQPKLTANASIKSITVQSGATLDMQTFNLNVSQNVDGGTTIYGSGAINMIGAGTLRGNVPSVNISGNVTVNGATLIEGNLTIGAGGTFTLNGNTVNVDHFFETNGGGTVVMNNSSDVLTLYDNATFSQGNETGKLTAGKLRVYKNLSVPACGSGVAFVASGTHTTMFFGPTYQLLDMACSSATQNRFQNIEINGTGLEANFVSMDVPVYASGNLALIRGVIAGGGILNIAGDVSADVGTGLSLQGLGIGGPNGTANVLSTGFLPVNLYLKGSGQPIRGGIPYQNVEVLSLSPSNAPAYFMGATTIANNLAITHAGAGLMLHGNTVTLQGSLNVSDGGVLIENNELDWLDVAGDASFGGGNQTGKLTSGVLMLRGNFTVACVTHADFVASVSHTTLFAAPVPPGGPPPVRTLQMGCSSPTENRFKNLEVETTGGTVNVTSSATQVMGNYVMQNGTLGGTGGITINGDLSIGGVNPTDVTIATMKIAGVNGTAHVFGPFRPGLMIFAGGTPDAPQAVKPLNYQNVQIDGFVIFADSTTTTTMNGNLTLSSGSGTFVQFGNTVDVRGSIVMNSGSVLNNPGHMFYHVSLTNNGATITGNLPSTPPT